jgi:pyruvyltransferase
MINFKNYKNKFLLVSILLTTFYTARCIESISSTKGLPLYYWQTDAFVNFGDYLSLKLVERIVGQSIETPKKMTQQKLLAIGSILTKASNGDIIWGSGIKRTTIADYKFTNLDVRAVRGPITRKFITENFNIQCPEVYGDPALLLPYFFPEFKKKKSPTYDYIIIPHYSEQKLFPKSKFKNVVYPTDPWDQVIEKILDSKFVISSSLHGLIIADAYQIPARMLRLTDHEPLLKYQDYYQGTNRPNFLFAKSVEEALKMGGEPTFQCDLEKLYASFPFDYWPNIKFEKDLKKFVR